MLKTVLLVLAVLLDLAALAGSLVLLPFSVMMFDAGETARLWAVFYGLMAVPLLAAGGVVGSLVVRFALRNPDLALWVAAAPLIYLLLFVVVVGLAGGFA